MSDGTVVIIDTCSQLSYNDNSLLNDGTGGTIAAIISLRLSLGKITNVEVVNDNSVNCEGYIDVEMFEKKYTNATPPMAFIHVRSKPGLLDLNVLAKRFPNTPIIHWQHITLWDYSLLSRVFDRSKREYTENLINLFRVCEVNNIPIIGTSLFHSRNIINAVNKYKSSSSIDVGWIYNPVMVCELYDQAAGFDPEVLLFASNPARGLNRAIKMFSEIKSCWPDMRLLVAAPAYSRAVTGNRINPGVEFLGSLPRRELWGVMDHAFALFYPNLEEAECFGYVYAESNALGCPVLTHNLGAAHEVLDDDEQVVNCSDINAILSRIDRWRQGERPIVSVNESFLPEIVAEKWYRLICRMVYK